MNSNTAGRTGKVAIVGGGLSAIYAFWGCLECGYNPLQVEVLVSSKPEPVGAVFMYKSPLPWLPVNVWSFLYGTCDDYSRKQWDGLDVRTSAHTRFEEGNVPFVGEDLWDPNEMLPTLWGCIPVVKKIGMLNSEDLKELKQKYEYVFCTFPDPDWVHAYREDNEIITFPIYRSPTVAANYQVIYNGQPELPWVRQTIKLNAMFTEYPYTMLDGDVLDYEHVRGNTEGILRRIPDLMPNTCPLSWAERTEGNLFRVGRQASFDRRMLSHEAHADVIRFLEQQ